jgi:hypothetical protein
MAHHAVAEGRQRHVATARPDERLKAQLGVVAAFGRRARVFDLGPDATRAHPPAGRQRAFQGLDRQRDIKGTSAPDCQVGRSEPIADATRSNLRISLVRSKRRR